MSEPLLYDTVDTLYHSVMDIMPQAVQDRDMASAFVLGSAGTYGATRGLIWLLKKLDKVIPNFNEKWLPRLEKAGIAITAAAPIVYAIIDPQGAREIVSQHPTYTSGMAGVWVGGITAAVQDLHKTSKKSLEDKLAEQNTE